jgi:hypothetical protein
MAQVAITSEQNFYPLKQDGKLIFPIGNFVTFLCGNELKMAIENKHIAHIYNVTCYNQSNFFKYYVDYFYKVRQQYKREGNEVFTYITKRFLNSLYGKFGQRMDTIFMEDDQPDSKYSSESLYDTDTGKRWKQTQIGTKRRIYQEGTEEAFNSFPAICAAITANARTLLQQYIIKAGEGNVFYCDTDSLFVNQAGYDNLKREINETKLGKLGVDKEGTLVMIHGAKDYSWNGKETIKGVNKTAKKVIGGVYDTFQFPGMKAELRKGVSDNYKILKIRKILSREYNKGVVKNVGFVTPIVLKEF